MSALRTIQKEIKQQIFNDYLDGIEIEAIRAKYGLKYGRSVYFHFPPLTRQHKLTHMANKIARQQKEPDDENNPSDQ